MFLRLNAFGSVVLASLVLSACVGDEHREQAASDGWTVVEAGPGETTLLDSASSDVRASPVCPDADLVFQHRTDRPLQMKRAHGMEVRVLVVDLATREPLPDVRVDFSLEPLDGGDASLEEEGAVTSSDGVAVAHVDAHLVAPARYRFEASSSRGITRQILIEATDLLTAGVEIEAQVKLPAPRVSSASVLVWCSGAVLDESCSGVDYPMPPADALFERALSHLGQPVQLLDVPVDTPCLFAFVTLDESGSPVASACAAQPALEANDWNRLVLEL